MIKELRKNQKIEIIDGVVSNIDKSPNSTNYFNCSDKCFNYALMRRTDKLLCVSYHAFETQPMPKRSENRY